MLCLCISSAIASYAFYGDESFTAANFACHVGLGQTRAVFPAYSVRILQHSLSQITLALTAGVTIYDIFVSPNRHLPQDQDPIEIARLVNTVFTNTSGIVWIGAQNTREWISGDTAGNLVYIKSMIYEFMNQGRSVGVFTTQSVWSTSFANADFTYYESWNPLSTNYMVRALIPLWETKMMYIGDDYPSIYEYFHNWWGDVVGGWGYSTSATSRVPPIMKAIPNEYEECGHIYGKFFY